jgi:hypothetical protein
MRTTLAHLFYIFTILMFALSACNLPSNNPVADVTATAPTAATLPATVTPSATPTLANTQTPTFTATETPPSEPSATATLEVPKAEVRRETNCRSGPAGNYDLIATYQVGQALEVIAKDLGSAYWFVRNPDQPEEQCYLLAQNIAISGDTSSLPKFTPLASPTEAPYFNVTFKKFDTCTGQDFAIFVVENAGSVEFRSVYLKVTDQKVNKSVEEAFNSFHQYVGCVLAREISPLNPGATGYVNSPRFPWQARGHKLRAVLMLCVKQDLKGECITQVVDVQP